MKISSALVALTITAALTSNAFASSSRKLGDVQVDPGKTASLDLSSLAQGVTYDVACTVRDPNNAANQVLIKLVAMNPGDAQPPQVVIGSNAGWGAYQAQLNSVDTQVSVSNIFNNNIQNSVISITNGDDKDSISMINCVAKPDPISLKSK